ncbi:nephrocystin-3-like isoform X2 [Xenia sp. Carnegie-2017]|uniref:nephrocystin-3-like isoform X2 n=1 Tax=Xenia sp. Carnegie-2017 TaxID=2897299 RepID=UPI001F0347E4|nr:nephrocystin-3-like isoform X2 [Xenia sp. Carnegie-2017]
MTCKIKSQRPSDSKTKAFGPKNIDHETNLDNISEKGLNEQLLKIRCIDAIAFNMVGRIYYDGGQYDKAKDSFKQSLKITTEVFGSEHVKRATTLYNMGLVFYDTAEYDKAKDFYEQALEIETKAFGTEHINVATTLHNLGLVFYDTAEYDKAKDFYEQALEIETKAFGPEHINVATTYNNLGLVYYDTAEYNKAKDFYRQALEIETKVFGPDHINVATTYNNLGLVYYDTAEYDKAKDFYEQALEIETKVFGPDHINVATTYNNLGLVYYDTAEYDKAKDFCEQALEIETKALGPDHINIATTYNNLGLVYKDMREYEKAKDFYEQAIEIETKAFGPDHVNIATTYNNLGFVYMRLEEYDKAKDLYERALDIDSIAEFVNMAATFNNLGCAYSHLKEYEMAKHYFERALLLKTKISVPNQPFNKGTILGNLISVCSLLGENKKTKYFSEQALEFEIGQIYSSCKEINEVDSCQLIDNIKLLPDSTLYGLEYRKQGIDCTVKEMKDSDLTGDTTTKMKKSYTIPDDDVENDDDFFIENFLDEYYGIRDEIHDILRSFSWIRGGYGVRWKPRLSLYVTVAAERKNDEDALRKEIDETFRWKASPYFEFEPEPKKSRFRWLSDLEVVKKENSFNPLTGKIDDECETRAKEVKFQGKQSL